MILVMVHCHVHPEQVEAFRRACAENAHCSLQEPGIFRFDVLQEQTDPTRFILAEGYRDENAPARHKETAHYQKWREAVAGMMQENRTSTKFDWIEPQPAAPQA